MKPVITVHNLSKQYRLGNIGTGSLHHDVNRWWHRVRGKEDPYLRIGDTNDRTVKGESQYVWALKNVSFNVMPGEVLGIIGRNGSGKSTLLKMLSRVTEPTTGRVSISGRVASLLEVGTGMHPDLTGRENIYLNGAILGMRKREIDSKLDAIIDFAGVERYIDTPVKRYSSGMHVRLGFAVAAHLDPEILIVDEVLAVGDAEFQQKCLGKMKEVSGNEGRTVLFVSHNIPTIQSLCKQVMILSNGELQCQPTTTSKAIDKYLGQTKEFVANTAISERTDRSGNGICRIIDLKIETPEQLDANRLVSGQKVKFVVDFFVQQQALIEQQIDVAISVSRLSGELITVMSLEMKDEFFLVEKELNRLAFSCEKLQLMTGTYIMNVCIKKNDTIYDWLQEAKVFEVMNGDYYNTGSAMPETHQGIYFDYEVA